MTAASDPLLSALRSRRSGIRSVRYRANRSVLLSVSRDGRTLNSHACFRDATPEVARAVAEFLTARRGSPASRRALDLLRSWEGTDRGLEAARQARPRRTRRATDGPETAPIRELFQRFNHDRFGDGLPAIPLRVSRRMTRTLGTIRYGPDGGGAAAGGGTAAAGGQPTGYDPGSRPESRSVLEIAIAADLLLPANRQSLEDTLLHEMAHAEAWLRYGHRGHGRPWRRIATRVGCTPRATCRSPIVRNRRR